MFGGRAARKRHPGASPAPCQARYFVEFGLCRRKEDDQEMKYFFSSRANRSWQQLEMRKRETGKDCRFGIVIEVRREEEGGRREEGVKQKMV